MTITNDSSCMRKTLIAFGVVALAFGAAACGGTQAAAPGPEAPQVSGSATPPPAAAATPAAEAKKPAEPLPPPVVLKDAGFKVPESVLYDPDQDVYLVSNINGKATEADRNGFITKLGPDGKVMELKFIDGSKGSFLSAPKGMAIKGDTLYVADITFIRTFDRKTGASKGKIGAPGATFLNDISVAPDGTVYVTDTGWKAGAQGFENTGSDAVFIIEPTSGAAKELIRNTKLGNPNGILADNEGAWVATSSGHLTRVTKAGQIASEQKLPDGSLDGLVSLSDGTFLVTSWASKTVYRGKPGGTFEAIATGLESPADIGFDTRRNQLLVPLFMKDEVQFHAVAGIAAVSAPGAAPSNKAVAAPAAPAATPAPAAPAAPPAVGTKAPPPAAEAKPPEAPAKVSAPAVAKPSVEKPKADQPASHTAPATAPVVAPVPAK